MATHQITIRDWFIRTFLDIKMNLRYIFKIEKEGIFKITSDYKLKFHDDFTSDYSSSWENSANWGLPQYHPAYLSQWYDPEQIKQTENGVEFSSVLSLNIFQK